MGPLTAEPACGQPDHGHRPLLRTRREQRPCHHTAEQRDEFAPFQAIECISFPPMCAGIVSRIPNWRGAVRGRQLFHNRLAIGRCRWSSPWRDAWQAVTSSYLDLLEIRRMHSRPGQDPLIRVPQCLRELDSCRRIAAACEYTWLLGGGAHRRARKHGIALARRNDPRTC